jgi:Fe-S-cluster containining protein
MLTGMELKKLAQSRSKQDKQVFQQLRKMAPHDVDALFHFAHEEVFAETDCLRCANCCKTTPAMLTITDISRIARHLKLSESDFSAQYVVADEDGDLIINRTPCPFLQSDNRCSIYEVRPQACREYPHTDRKKVKQLLDLTFKNREVCPAVLDIIDLVKESIEDN